MGHVLIQNIREAAYQGELYAVNPKYRSVRGVTCYASVAALPDGFEDQTGVA